MARVAVVTGGTRGIGAAISLALQAQGRTVIATYAGNDAAAEAFKAEHGIATSKFDVGSFDACTEAVTRIAAEFGPVEILVNNAGITRDATMLRMRRDLWDAVIDTNLNGSWYMMQGAAKRWVEQGRSGNIVNITAAIDRGLTGMAHTTASRAGVIALSRTLAIEWAEHGIRLNCIGAGAIESNGFNNYREENVATFYSCNPMKRAGDVQDIAEAVVYLAAPSGKFITGEVLNVEGGMLLWGEFWPAGKPDYFKVDPA